MPESTNVLPTSCFDIIVVGGSYAGMAAALQAARGSGSPIVDLSLKASANGLRQPAGTPVVSEML